MSNALQLLMNCYIESMPNKIQEIDMLFEMHTKMACKNSQLATSKLQLFLHNLSGSGGIYGLNEITAAAQASLNALVQSEDDVLLLKDKLSALKDILTLIHKEYCVTT